MNPNPVFHHARRALLMLLAIIITTLALAACSDDTESAGGETSGDVRDDVDGGSDADGDDDRRDDDEESAVDGTVVADNLVGRIGGLVGADGEPLADDEADAVRAQLIELLVPDGVDVDDPAFAEALAARLGPDYAGIDDVDELIEALIDELDLEPGEEIQADDLLERVDEWASDGVVRLGGGTSGDRTAVIDLSTSFDEAVAILDGARPVIDVLPGLGSIELRDVDLRTDSAARSVVIVGHLPSPFSADVTATLDWRSGSPSLSMTARRSSLTLADLTDHALGTAGDIGLDDVALSITADGIAIDAGVDPSTIAGTAGIDLPGGAVPLTAQFPGFGAFGAGSVEVAFDLEIPIPLEPIARWNTDRSGMLTIAVSADPMITYGEVWRTRLGGDELTFTGSVALGTGGRADLVLSMDGDWTQPFDIEWLTLRDVVMTTSTSGGSTAASLGAGFSLGTRTGRIELRIADDGSAAATGTLDRITIDDLTGFAELVAGQPLLPDSLDLPDDLFVLNDVTLSFDSAGGGSTVSLAASTELLGNRADAVFAVVSNDRGGRSPILAVTPRGVTLGSLLPVLADEPSVGGIAIPESAIVLTSGPITAPPGAFPDALRSSLAIPSGSSAAPFRLGGGLSLAGVIPGGAAPGLDDVKEALGMDRSAPMRIGGTLPLAAVTGGSATDFALDLSLPEMQPAGSPAWFVSAQLGIRVTGEPSVGVVGSLTMDLAGDIQTFEVELAVSGGKDASFEIVGRLANPWETPFGVDWLTLDEVVLKLGVDARGSVTIGFLADMDIGSKDIRGAMAVSINAATGAPTNFAFAAESAAGVSMGDLADLYALMSGEPRPPVESALPAAEVRNLALRFAPQADPDLGIEQGFRIAGELWMGNRPGAPLELLVGVDIEIATSGIAVDGFLTDFTLGPVEFDETALAIRVSALEQRFAFSGGIEIADQAVSVSIELSPSTLSFGSTVTVNGGRAELRITAGLDLLEPSFEITAIMDEQFLRNVDAALEASLGRQVTDINRTISDARSDINRISPLLRTARKTLDTAQDAVNATGCGWPFGYLCDRLNSARSTVRSYERQLSAAQTRLADAERLLERYDIDLTLVGAEFTASWDGFDAGTVEMVLQVDANGLRVPVAIDWDFNKSIDDNVDGVLDQFV
ncbi:MAG: hypothetical protein AAGE98_14230 [Actinomycetota bacterium]